MHCPPRCVGFGPAVAADYPTRTVKIIVSYPPGGTTDVLARIIAQWLTEKMGQQFIIENKPGGGNNIGADFALKSPPDGYTLFLVNPANGINHTLYKNLPFSILTDVAPVAGLITSPNVMEVTNAFPAKTVAEFIAYCKANPGKINMASSGAGTSVHMSGELFMMMTGCKMLHVPYKGAGPALTELMGGTVHVLFDNLPSSAGHIKGGRIRAHRGHDHDARAVDARRAHRRGDGARLRGRRPGSAWARPRARRGRSSTSSTPR